jgi:UDP-N-acetylmuramoyl-L-alanyl-D-glutamate--2,6-diaminopimelate ligase
MFFDALPAGAFALVIADDKVGEVMLQNTRADKYRYSLRTLADFKGRILESRLDGTTLEINGHQLEVQFTGRFNAYNLLSVYGAALLLGFDPQQVLVKMSMLVPVAGRFQTLRSPRGYTAIIDYAHTPDALVNVLDTIREVVGTGGHIITVCGCGGELGTNPNNGRPMLVIDPENGHVRDRNIDKSRSEHLNEIIQTRIGFFQRQEEVKPLMAKYRDMKFPRLEIAR